jgi:hypothetical protein
LAASLVSVVADAQLALVVERGARMAQEAVSVAPVAAHQA